MAATSLTTSFALSGAFAARTSRMPAAVSGRGEAKARVVKRTGRTWVSCMLSEVLLERSSCLMHYVRVVVKGVILR